MENIQNFHLYLHPLFVQLQLLLLDRIQVEIYHDLYELGNQDFLFRHLSNYIQFYSNLYRLLFLKYF